MEEDSLNPEIELVLIGGSAGSLEVLFKLLPLLKADLKPAIIVVLHRKSAGDSSLIDLLSTKTVLPIQEAEDKDLILPGNMYLAPSDYHLLIEKNRTFTLDYSEKINFSRPSLDVTFEAAADIFGALTAGIILSGANDDGTIGLRAIKKAGGKIIAQDPTTAQMPLMPQHAINNLKMDHIFNTVEMAGYLNNL
ncbi:chemotaxis protein CheB [Dyadobacter psychrotolerans]|uniref:protein-glutamate methylesterase n=1 Tax=Dyadobacter psychrotolerans TaxID=2541721 RepID=A0A4R5DT67_9BACT|nr:chemotaxis protein CheB [Dyadobacter psychrotolerans]TDE15470.1 chemotaxis protein CheB [Dyadobacter psychrotolerans]